MHVEMVPSVLREKTGATGNQTVKMAVTRSHVTVRQANLGASVTSLSSAYQMEENATSFRIVTMNQMNLHFFVEMV